MLFPLIPPLRLAIYIHLVVESCHKFEERTSCFCFCSWCLLQFIAYFLRESYCKFKSCVLLFLYFFLINCSFDGKAKSIISYHERSFSHARLPSAASRRTTPFIFTPPPTVFQKALILRSGCTLHTHAAFGGPPRRAVPRYLLNKLLQISAILHVLESES